MSTIGILLAAVAVGCDRCSHQRPSAGASEDRVSDEAIVGIVERHPNEDVQTCVGTVVATEPFRTLVLTAAHCLVRDGREVSLAVRTSDGRLLTVTERWKHPRFSQRAMSSAYDVALLAVDAAFEPHAIPIGERGELHAASALALLSLRHDERVPDQNRNAWTDVEPTRVSTLSFAITGLGPDTCRGTSGAPIVNLRDGRRSIVGVVSRGSPSCTDTGTAARAWPALAMLRSKGTGEAATTAPAGQLCGECIDALAEMDDRCVSPLSDCREHRECRAWLDCLASCSDDTCMADCARSQEPENRRNMLCRCISRNGCGRLCAASCPDTGGHAR